MVLTDIQNECAFHYTLESFGEKREYAERTTSYFGQRIDGPHNGPAPGLWEIEIKPTALFKDHQETAEIPHTAYVQHCEACKWNMKVRCDTCSGKGETLPLNSWGTGKRICKKWQGKAREEICEKCRGKGLVECGACDGHGELVHFQVLVATWKTCTEDFISNTSNLPKGLILEAEGEQIYKEEGKMVHPIDLDLDKEVNEASTTLITKHYASSVDEEIIAQRHFLRTVPLTKATYTWRNKEGEFYVYGLERKVYFEDYPQTCGNCICC
ncbi:Protein SSUH2 like protein [Argiope bruennichi]|uniref:Protein SSUH2 like protein n=1 Tax=Argiope bruennichi TaxID=94029 RepID=A0A8T0E2X7_ARGBR|nr:Protein SSUH2 like protein [Argiope bruennichi]